MCLGGTSFGVPSYGLFVSLMAARMEEIVEVGDAMSFELRCASDQTGWQRSVRAARTAMARLAGDESGQDLIEYALIATVLGLGTLLTVHGAANTIVNMVLQVGTSFTNAV
jgi:pilus assembly protein Flp/PilA